MGERFYWYKEPIVVVPAAFAVGALVFVPFQVWGTAGAPAFYGSLTAALIAAGAVVGNARLNAAEHDRHRSEDIALQSRRDALKLLGHIEQIATHLESYLLFLKGTVYTVAPGAAPSPSDPATYFTAKSIREMIGPILDFDVTRIVELSATIPDPLGLRVANTLSGGIREIKVSLVLNTYKDAEHPPRTVIDGALALAAGRIQNLRAIEKDLKTFIAIQ